MNVFSVLKFVTLDHRGVEPAQVTMTDLNGKPNAVLTDLLHDVMTKLAMFVNLDQIEQPLDAVEQLSAITPLPADVLEEYQKLLDQVVYQINFAAKKGLIEIVYDDFI